MTDPARVEHMAEGLLARFKPEGPVGRGEALAFAEAVAILIERYHGYRPLVLPQEGVSEPQAEYVLSGRRPANVRA